MATQMACSICRRPLDSYTHDNTEEWIHPEVAAPYDHEPQPVLMDSLDLVTVCDFCANPYPLWRYPATSFTIDTGLDVDWGSTEDWAACTECHRLIENGYWRQLANRTMDRHPEWRGAQRTVIRQDLMKMHQQFHSHRTGPAQQIYDK